MTVAWRPLLRGTVSAGVLLSWLVAAYVGSSGIGDPDVSAAIAVFPLLLAGAMMLGTHLGRAWAWLLAVLLVGSVVTLWPLLRLNVRAVYYLQHVGTHLVLAAVFGRTLIGERDALITRMARFIHGEQLSERHLRYTRQVTAAWTVFFLANAAVSTLVFVSAPVGWWAVYANLLTGPLIGLMFVGEHFVRVRVLPPHERPTFKEILLAYKQRQRPGLDKPASRS
jgi:uncharacterized membrane protein